MKKVEIKTGCIACGTCVFIAPEVFTVTDVSRVKEHADIQKYAPRIQEAAKQCPVRVIAIKE